MPNKNRLYWAYERDSGYGVFVSAESSTEARQYGMGEMGCDYIEVNARLVQKGDIYRHYDDKGEEDGSHVEIIKPVAWEVKGVIDYTNFIFFAIKDGEAKLIDEDSE